MLLTWAQNYSRRGGERNGAEDGDLGWPKAPGDVAVGEGGALERK